MATKLEKLYLVFFNLILSIGCFWQIFNVCDLYFKYPTNIFIKTNFEPLSKPLPAITLVTRLGDQSFLNSTEVMEIGSGKFKNKTFKTISKEGPDGVKISLLKEYLDTAIERVSLHYYSITFNSVLTAKKQTTLLKSNENIHFHLNAFGVNNRWWFHLHNSYDMPSSYDQNTIAMKKKTFSKVTWKMDAFQLLESPYPTNCKNYRTSSPYLTRKDCIRNCKLRVSTGKCGYILDGIDLFRDEKSVPFGDYKNQSCIKNIDFDSICNEECPHSDCNIEYYEPILTADWGQEYCSFSISFPTKPETAYFHEPRIQTIEFVCYLASTVCLWFGLSFYSINNVFIIFSKRLFNNPYRPETSDKRHCKCQCKPPIKLFVMNPKISCTDKSKTANYLNLS